MVTVRRSTILPCAASRAWALIRDFNAMPAWNANVLGSRIEDGPGDRVGCLRVLRFDDGADWTHRLTGLSDEDMKLQYRIVGGPPVMRIPVTDYRATLQVRPVAGHPTDACEVLWSAEFETPEPHAMGARAGAVFEAGFEGLRRRLAAG